VIFDFEGPRSRDLTETTSTLAHMARFIIADITDARSIPQELTTIVPALPSVPVQPIQLVSQREYGLFEHFKRFPWVYEVRYYSDVSDAANIVDDTIATAMAETRRFHTSESASDCSVVCWPEEARTRALGGPQPSCVLSNDPSAGTATG
jgi:hypothetical protein